MNQMLVMGAFSAKVLPVYGLGQEVLSYYQKSIKMAKDRLNFIQMSSMDLLYTSGQCLLECRLENIC